MIPYLLVVSRFNEKLEWLKQEPFSKFPVLIYNKGDDQFYRPPNSWVVQLANVGRESHSYLYHILFHYNHHAKVTIFLPGSMDKDYKMSRALRMIEEIRRNHCAVFLGEKYENNAFYSFQLEEWTSTSQENHEKNPESTLAPARIRPFGKWYDSTFSTPLRYFSYYGIFSVDRSDILQRPRLFYKNLLKELAFSSNPEVGHYIERSWASVLLLKETKVL